MKDIKDKSTLLFLTIRIFTTTLKDYKEESKNRMKDFENLSGIILSESESLEAEKTSSVAAQDGQAVN